MLRSKVLGLTPIASPERHDNYKGIIEVYNSEGILIDTFNGSREIKSKGYDHSAVYKCLNGKQHTHKNCTFKRKIT